MLNREQILSKSKVRIEKVFLPGSKEDFVYVREISSVERDEWEASNLIHNRMGARGKGTFDVHMSNARARLVIIGTCDEAGKRIFTDEDEETVGLLGSGVVSRLYDVIASISGISNQDFEDIIKN